MQNFTIYLVLQCTIWLEKFKYFNKEESKVVELWFLKKSKNIQRLSKVTPTCSQGPVKIKLPVPDQKESLSVKISVSLGLNPPIWENLQN